MDSWLTAHGIHSVERPKWHVPTVEEVDTEIATQPESHSHRRSTAAAPDPNRRGLHNLVDAIAPKDFEVVRTFLQLLADRRSAPPTPAHDPIEVPAETAETESN